MKVPFFSFENVPKSIKRRWLKAIREVVKSGVFVGGEHVGTFEHNFAKKIGSNYGIGVANGFDALILALKALEIGEGKKVAVPAHTFIATWLAVERVGATPIGIDCDSSGVMNIELLKTLDEDIDAVIPVHMHGKMVDMVELTNWTFPLGIKVIEDCAQSHGASQGGKFAGSFGDIGAFSFYPTKNLGAIGDAGALVTNDPNIAKTLSSIRNYGNSLNSKYEYVTKGYNSRLDPIQANVLNINLEHLDKWNLKRRKIAYRYLEEINFNSISPLHSKDSNSVWHHFVVLTNLRNELREFLSEHHIATEIHYPNTAEIAFSKIHPYKREISKNAEKISKSCLSLPLSPWMTSKEVDYVINCINEFEKQRIEFGNVKY